MTGAIERLSCDISNEGGRDKLLETMKELISRKQEIMDKKNKYSVAVKEKLTSAKSLPNSRSSEAVCKNFNLLFICDLAFPILIFLNL